MQLALLLELTVPPRAAVQSVALSSPQQCHHHRHQHSRHRGPTAMPAIAPADSPPPAASHGGATTSSTLVPTLDTVGAVHDEALPPTAELNSPPAQSAKSG